MSLFKRCDCAQPAQCQHPYYYRFMFDGKRLPKSTGTSLKKIAQQIENAAKTRKVMIKGGILRGDVAARGMALDLVRQRFAEYYAIEFPRTAAGYALRQLEHFVAHFGATTLITDIKQTQL